MGARHAQVWYMHRFMVHHERQPCEARVLYANAAKLDSCLKCDSCSFSGAEADLACNEVSLV